MCIRYAWGHDGFKPLSQTHTDDFHLGLTLVDALDTLYIMGLKEEFNEATEWVKTQYKADTDVRASVFETTIRVL